MMRESVRIAGHVPWNFTKTTTSSWHVVSVHQFTILKQCEPICLGTRLVPSRQISGRPATRVKGWSRLIHRSLGFCKIFRETKWNERDPPLNNLGQGFIASISKPKFWKSSHWSRKPSSLIHCRAGELPALPGLVVATSATGIYWISRKICWNPKHVGDQDAKLQEKNSEIWKQKKSLQLPWTIPELRTFCQLQRFSVQIVTFPRSRYSEIHWADRALPAVPQSSLRKPRFISP